MLKITLASLVVVALSEMGDKTQLLAFSLAARFKRPWLVMGGIFVATILNHGLASYFGAWISSIVSQRVLTILLAVSFFAFGLWTLKPDRLEESKRETGLGAFVTTTVLFFLIEIGDKTQLATVALAAKYKSVLWVTIGTTAGMLIADGLVVFLGDKLAQKIPMVTIRRVAAGLFFVLGSLSLISLWN
jgi:Ca2+/H+ antiporter, TMEM165/GDT1 family